MMMITKMMITKTTKGDDNVEVVKGDKNNDKKEKDKNKEDELEKGFAVLTDPVKDLGKAEFVPVHRAVDERVSLRALDLDVKAVATQEDISGGESDALVAVEEAVVIA